MFLTNLPRALLRLWYLTLVGLLMTAGLTYLTVQRVQPVYTAVGEVLLLPPRPTVPTGGNPYLYLGGLDVAGDILAKAMSDDATATALKAQGVRDEFTVVMDGAAAAPMILVTTTAADGASALRSLGVVLDRLPRTLEEVQRLAKAPSNAMIRSTLITRTTEPTLSLKPVLRAGGIAAAGGLVLTLMTVALADSIGRRPKRPGPRHGRHEKEVPAEPAPRRPPSFDDSVLVPVTEHDQHKVGLGGGGRHAAAPDRPAGGPAPAPAPAPATVAMNALPLHDEPLDHEREWQSDTRW